MDDRLRDPKLVNATIGLVAFGIGAGLGYILGKRQRKFIHAVPAQDWSMADLAAVPDKEEVVIEEVVEVETDETVEVGKSFIEKTLGNGAGNEPIKANVFDKDEWDYEAEVAKRTDQEPYVLHQEEFHSDEKGYSQTTLTYYAGDDILVDQDNTPVYNYSTILGPLLFGHGSGDESVVYIRNDKLRAEYEVVRDLGMYIVEVMGEEVEETARSKSLEHSAERKFRQE